MKHHTQSDILKALAELRIGIVSLESDLQETVEQAFKEHDIAYRREVQLDSRSRIDFLVEPGIGVELKKGKPNRKAVINQLERYAASDQIQELILIIESAMDLPESIGGKPCMSLALRKQWGIAL